MNLLLISNSTNAGEAYLEYPMGEIKSFLAARAVTRVLFIPYAGVTVCWNDYLAKVEARFASIGVAVDGIHNFANAAQAVLDAQAIVVGGGNSFSLLKWIQDSGIVEPVREKVMAGTPYIGWSAGSNVAGPGIYTTNDMPIVEPMSFKAFNLVPFQINPHYLDAHPDGHAGETREQRIEEFIQLSKGTFVAGLREGCMLLVEGGKMRLIGARPMRLFHYGQPPRELLAKDDLSFLL